MNDDVRVVRYNSPEEIWTRFWSDAGGDDAVAREGVFGFTGADGEEREMAFADVIESLTAMGAWAHADVLDNTIHLWVGDAPMSLVVEMLGHELGHLSALGRDPRTLDHDLNDADVDMAEEQRADVFGGIAAQAYRIATEAAR